MSTEERLVLKFVDGDGCTYACDVVLPIVAESAEAAYVELLSIIEQRWSTKDFSDFKWKGHTLNVNFFYDHGLLNEPEILTLDEWYAQESY